MHQDEIQRYHVDLLNGGVLTRTFDSVWAAHKGNLSNPKYMWKMHLYADSYQDWYNLSRVVIPWLVSQNATFKTVNPDMYSINSILQDRTDDQFGKAFTIYPNNEQEFKELALGLEQILTTANLQTRPNLNEHKHNMAFERMLGLSGRIFYRAERDINGNHIPAYKAAELNPVRPYNPYNYPDPFINLFEPNIKDAIAQIKNMSVVTPIKHSADNNNGSYYFQPRTDSDMAILEMLFKIAGIKYDLHFSRLYDRNVIRVLEQELPSMMRLQQPPKTIHPNVLYGMQNKQADM